MVEKSNSDEKTMFDLLGINEHTEQEKRLKSILDKNSNNLKPNDINYIYALLEKHLELKSKNERDLKIVFPELNSSDNAKNEFIERSSKLIILIYDFLEDANKSSLNTQSKKDKLLLKFASFNKNKIEYIMINNKDMKKAFESIYIKGKGIPISHPIKNNNIGLKSQKKEVKLTVLEESKESNFNQSVNPSNIKNEGNINKIYYLIYF